MVHKDPASEESQIDAESKLDKIGVAVGVTSLAIIGRALGRIDEETTLSDALIYANQDIAEFEAIMEYGAAAYDAAIEQIYDNLADLNDKWAQRYYEYAKVEQVPALEHPRLSTILNQGKSEAAMTAEMMCNSSVVGLVDRNGKFLPFEQEYKAAVNRAVNAMSRGEAAYNTEILKTVKQMSNSGLRVQYASGLTRELFAAARTSIMDGYRATMMQERKVQGVEFGANGKEISAHMFCAPDHLPYQGEQFTYKEFYELQNGDLRGRPIETGANCRHIAYDIIKGVTEPAFSSKQLEEYRKNSESKIRFKGISGQELEMSGYESTQYQRKIETRIRVNKTESTILEEAGFPAFAKQTSATAAEYMRYYKHMSKSLGLPLRLDNTRAYQI